MATYFISRGLFRPALQVELDGTPPCLWCGDLVTSPSMDGPLICGACDCGRNKDGSKWTAEQYAERCRHRAAMMAKYAAAAEAG